MPSLHSHLCLRKGGNCVSITPNTLGGKPPLHPKFWLRPVTTRIDKSLLFQLCELSVPTLLAISNAFDRVPLRRLVVKLQAKGCASEDYSRPCFMVAQRTAHVVAGGVLSIQTLLRNIVFQGTVLGPMLRNSFFEDAPAVGQRGLFHRDCFCT